MALSTLTINKLRPPKQGRLEKFDVQVPGFGVRVTERGVKSWIFVYRSPTKRKRVRVTIGRVGEIDLETAREQARQLRAQIRAGVEPSEASGDRTLFRDAVDLFEKRCLVNMRSGREARQIIDRELMPTWKDRPIAAITRGDVFERVEGLIDRGSPESARRLFSIIRRFFNWAISRGTFGIDRSPCDRLRPADLVGKQPSRSRILTDDELRALWAVTERMGYPFGPVLRLLMLTGLRRTEVAEACWFELDLHKAIFTIPNERMKSDTAFTIPLTTEMMAVIQALPRIDGGEFLFTSGKVGDRPVSGFSQMKKKLNRLMAATGAGTDWTVHDIRRTFRTHLSALPVPGGDLVRELMLAHAKPGLHRVYDQFGYLEERREGYRLWNDRLMQIIGSGQSVAIS
jgi:integrase